MRILPSTRCDPSQFDCSEAIGAVSCEQAAVLPGTVSVCCLKTHSSVRPRESGDPAFGPWIPAFAGMNGIFCVVGNVSPKLRHNLPSRGEPGHMPAARAVRLKPRARAGGM